MPRLRRRVVSGDTEKNIVTGMIVSSRFCRDVLPMLKFEYLQIDYAKTVVKWIMDYYKAYKEAPGKHIQDIFNMEKDGLKEAEASLIEKFLLGLSDRYEEQEQFNVEYLLDQAVGYFKVKSLDVLSQRISGYLAKGKADLAEQEVRDYGKIAKMTSGWINPFEPQEIMSTFDEEEHNRLFRFPGVLGEMSGDFEREWLIAFMGPMKRGKTFSLQEFAVQALTHRLKTVVISLEMSKTKMKNRLYARITGLAKYGGEYVYPLFDCVRNQDGTCEMKERENRIKVVDSEGKVVGFSKRLEYKPCFYCREKRGRSYVPAVWYSVQRQERDLSTKTVKRKILGFKRLFGDNLRIIAYPSFAAGLDDVSGDLDNLEHTEGFVPSVIIVDYADILAPEDKRLSERGNIDVTWKRMKGMAGERHCLVATATQASRRSIERRSVRQTDTSEDIRKLAHADMMFSLNQTPEEKAQGVMRVGVMIHRHEEFHELGHVKVLQQLQLGQPLLDSEWDRRK